MTEQSKLVLSKLGKELCEKVSRSIIVCEVSGAVNEQLLRLKIIRKTRSKRYPVMATEYGNAILGATSFGRAYINLGTK